MSAFNIILKEQREAKKLSIPFIASKLGVAETVIQTLENSDLSTNIYPINAKISYIKRYAEFLGIPSEKTTKAINEIHSDHQKKMRKSNLTWFDYLNRLVILALIIWLVYLVYGLYMNSLNAESTNNSEEIIIQTQQLPQYEDLTLEKESPQTGEIEYIHSEWIPESDTNEVEVFETSPQSLPQNQ
jgi:cytoskeletal protein RodZ